MNIVTTSLMTLVAVILGSCVSYTDSRTFSITYSTDTSTDASSIVIKEYDVSNEPTDTVPDEQLTTSFVTTSCTRYRLPELSTLPEVPNFEDNITPIEVLIAEHIKQLRVMIKEDRKKIRDSLDEHYKECGE